MSDYTFEGWNEFDVSRVQYVLFFLLITINDRKLHAKKRITGL